MATLPVIFEFAAQASAAKSDDGVGPAHRPKHSRALQAVADKGFAAGFAPNYRSICAFSAKEPDRLSSIIAKSVYFRPKRASIYFTNQMWYHTRVMGKGHRKGWKKAELKKGFHSTSMPEDHLTTKGNELVPSPPEPTPKRGSDSERRGRFLFVTLLSSNLFALFVGGLYEYLALRGVVNMAASRVVLIGVWLIGILIASIIIWASSAYRKRLTFAVSAIFLGLALWSLDAYVSRLIARKPQPVSATPAPVSIYLGCSMDHLPILIPAASTIHIISLNPATLKTANIFASTGAIQDVTAGSDKPRVWPSKSEGRWMTDAEIKSKLQHGSMPTPFDFKCTISGYTTSAIEDLTATLIVLTPDNRTHPYSVHFDPLTMGNSFTFYVVNVCSSGVAPLAVTWDSSATLLVFGEGVTRQVPLKYERRGFPADLMPTMGPSAFLWSGIHDCDWDSK